MCSIAVEGSSEVGTKFSPTSPATGRQARKGRGRCGEGARTGRRDAPGSIRTECLVVEFLWRGRFLPEPYEPLAGDVDLGLERADLGRARTFDGARAEGVTGDEGPRNGLVLRAAVCYRRGYETFPRTNAPKLTHGGGGVEPALANVN